MDAKHPSFMTTGTSHAIRVLLTLLLIVCAAMLSSSGQFYREALVDAFFAFALASVVIIHLRISPSWTDAVLLPAIAFVPAIVDFRLLHYQPRLMAGLSFLGLSSFLIMATRTVWAKEATTVKKLLYAWAPAALFVLSEYSASTMLQWTTAAHPKTLDLYLLSFDYSLHVPIVFITGQLYSLRPWLHNASLLAYVGLAVPIALVYAGRLVRFKEKASSAMLAFLITGPLGILFYNLFPACGPHALFQQGFPFHPFPMAQASRLQLEAMVVPGPRNAIPSLHMAWVLLAWWYSRGLSWIERLIALTFVIFTVFATLGTGEHWFVDLIVAFPFALFVQAVAAYSVSWKDGRRVAAFLFGLLCTLGWLVMLRYGAKIFWSSPVIPWTLAVATVALSVIRQVKLEQSVADSDFKDLLPGCAAPLRAAQLHVAVK